MPHLVNIEACPVPVSYGSWKSMPPIVRNWAVGMIQMCQPKDLHIMDGSDEEDNLLKGQLVERGVLIPLRKYENCYLARTDPRDVARVESRTVISTLARIEAIPDTSEGVTGQLGYWMSPKELDHKIHNLFPGSMKGRTMYVVPFSMGPVGGPMSKNGIELTDSAYVAISMHVMARVGLEVFKCIEREGYFIRCLHSVGVPLEPGSSDPKWPCNPDKTLIAHIPQSNDIFSFGSGYGGNSLLGKKCFALRIGSALAKKEGWLAEHMLIMGIKKPGESEDKRRYICAAFPSACGKTNLAMLKPALEGYDITCEGDDIAWLRFDKNGCLRAINPEYGFFGVAPGTSEKSNPNAMKAIFTNTIFTNVALTDDGGVWWEGLTDTPPDHLIDWLGNDWTPACKTPPAHPNSRFCTPAKNCPILDSHWEDPEGVKIEAILLGGRRPDGVPLVFEAFSWQHGVFLGATLKSEATAAAEHKSKVVMHDPFSMRPFFGYNFGGYLSHWLSLGDHENLPKFFMVNWFRRDASGGFMWPGFGDNVRVLEWILKRCEVTDNTYAIESPIGLIPAPGSLRLDGIKNPVDMEGLFSTPKEFWLEEVTELSNYFRTQVGSSLPQPIWEELEALHQRILGLP